MWTHSIFVTPLDQTTTTADISSTLRTVCELFIVQTSKIFSLSHVVISASSMQHRGLVCMQWVRKLRFARKTYFTVVNFALLEEPSRYEKRDLLHTYLGLSFVENGRTIFKHSIINWTISSSAFTVFFFQHRPRGYTQGNSFEIRCTYIYVHKIWKSPWERHGNYIGKTRCPSNINN